MAVAAATLVTGSTYDRLRRPAFSTIEHLLRMSRTLGNEQLDHVLASL